MTNQRSLNGTPPESKGANTFNAILDKLTQTIKDGADPKKRDKVVTFLKCFGATHGREEPKKSVLVGMSKINQTKDDVLKYLATQLINQHEEKNTAQEGAIQSAWSELANIDFDASPASQPTLPTTLRGPDVIAVLNELKSMSTENPLAQQVHTQFLKFRECVEHKDSTKTNLEITNSIFEQGQNTLKCSDSMSKHSLEHLNFEIENPFHFLNFLIAMTLSGMQYNLYPSQTDYHKLARSCREFVNKAHLSFADDGTKMRRSFRDNHDYVGIKNFKDNYRKKVGYVPGTLIEDVDTFKNLFSDSCTEWFMLHENTQKSKLHQSKKLELESIQEVVELCCDAGSGIVQQYCSFGLERDMITNILGSLIYYYLQQKEFLDKTIIGRGNKPSPGMLENIKELVGLLLKFTSALGFYFTLTLVTDNQMLRNLFYKVFDADTDCFNFFERTTKLYLDLCTKLKIAMKPVALSPETLAILKQADNDFMASQEKWLIEEDKLRKEFLEQKAGREQSIREEKLKKEERRRHVQKEARDKQNKETAQEKIANVSSTHNEEKISELEKEYREIGIKYVIAGEYQQALEKYQALEKRARAANDPMMVVQAMTEQAECYERIATLEYENIMAQCHGIGVSNHARSDLRKIYQDAYTMGKEAIAYCLLHFPSQLEEDEKDTINQLNKSSHDSEKLKDIVTGLRSLTTVEKYLIHFYLELIGSVLNKIKINRHAIKCVDDYLARKKAQAMEMLSNRDKAITKMTPAVYFSERKDATHIKAGELEQLQAQIKKAEKMAAYLKECNKMLVPLLPVLQDFRAMYPSIEQPTDVSLAFTLDESIEKLNAARQKRATQAALSLVPRLALMPPPVASLAETVNPSARLEAKK